MKKNLVLITTTHNLVIDKKTFNQVSKQLYQLFSNIYVSISTTTGTKTYNLFNNDRNYKCLSIKPAGAADARRKVLNFAYTDLKNKSDYYFFYCDFDKIIVAILNKLNDFRNYLTNLQYHDDYRIIGRNKACFLTYPKSWKDTETITNQVASKLFSIKDLDILAGCCAFSASSATYIINNSLELLTDTEWPIICKKNHKTINYDNVSFLPYKEQYNSGRNDDNWRSYIPRLRLALIALESFNNWKN